MRTVTYTYDENNPTNKDYLIEALTESIDDGGASYECVAHYHISCPYCSGECLNSRKGNEYGTSAFTDTCTECKLSWLDKAYDT